MSKTCPVCNTTYDDGLAFCPTDGSTLHADESGADLVGSVIADRYLVQELLGEGGMGRVYLARHVRLPQQAAIKVLHPGMVADTGAVARFNREAANAARIEHDRVARVFDFGETRDGLVYLAMEYVPGRTLRALLHVEPRLPVVRAANIVFQIAEGLDAAHRIGIVHRDLKPDNILVVTDEQGLDRCKVVDFGIAKAVDKTETQLTQAGMLVGTPEFMSPEQVLGETLDARSDVYALALVAFLAITGNLPFSATTAERSLTQRLIEDPRTLAVVAPDIPWPEALQQAFDRALQREPADRTGSALEFADAMVSAVEGWTGVSVLRPRTPMSTPALTGAASKVTAASLTPPSSRTIAGQPTAPVAAPTASVPASAEATASVPAPRKRSPALAIAAGLGLVVLAGGGYLAMSRGGGAGGTTAAPDATTSADSAPALAGTAGSGTQPASAAMSAARTPAGGATPPGAAPLAAPGVVTAGAGASTAAVVPVSGVDEAARAADAAAARQERQAINAALEAAADDDVAAARSAIAKLTALLPRFTQGADSTRVYLDIAIANVAAGDEAGVCAALQKANRSGASREQLQMIRAVQETLEQGCKL